MQFCQKRCHCSVIGVTDILGFASTGNSQPFFPSFVSLVFVKKHLPSICMYPIFLETVLSPCMLAA